jgi:hypothetical protein
MTVCRNRARNLVRDASRAQQRIASLRPLLDGTFRCRYSRAPASAPEPRGTWPGGDIGRSVVTLP